MEERTSHIMLLPMQEGVSVDGAEKAATPGDVVEHDVEGAGRVSVPPQQQIAEAGVVVQGDVARCRAQTRMRRTAFQCSITGYMSACM